MLRKEIEAILEDDFINFLKQNNLLEKFQNKEIECSLCNTPITLDNIFAIYFDQSFKFCCNDFSCAEKFNQRENR